MNIARNPILQVDVDLSEDGQYVCATGHTADDDDTAFLSMRLPTADFDGDEAMAFDYAAGFLTAFLQG
ncbi:hypothetical protein [Mesorhizobium sp. LjNodule214]|uniref:hypothetical protein n=1 Tax=Mesorhizobium sp. LjNodule214 TaxID=3342252 RepID=UPI003ECD94C9